ncbi:MAG TPA: hypothetical protein PLF78_15720, partial [Caulobacter sp.]|nr:hypothetical protein [Caulobacter sp.]
MKRVANIGLGTLLVLAALASWGFLALNHTVNDPDVPVAKTLLVKGAPKTVLAVWAHPDDEITSAGTLARLAKEEGARL